ncbi:hypothetical protein ACWGCW_18725 [Streptomyces sp. NPDC054933]
MGASTLPVSEVTRRASAQKIRPTAAGSSRTQLLEAKANLRRRLASIALTEDEPTVVDDGQAAVDTLLARLTDIPTPAGPHTARAWPPRHRHRAARS